MDSQYTYKPSEGEEFLEDYFFSIGIEFESQKKILSLKNDFREFRIADFYLPKYKVYVEFFGLWNNNGNEEYRRKKEIYKLNNIPCIYIYPENLGIIDYTFDKRIQLELEKYKLKRELRAYKLFKFKKTPELKNRLANFGIAVTVLLYFLFSLKLNLKGYLLIGVLGLIALYQVDQLFQLYLDIFKRNKFPLSNI